MESRNPSTTGNGTKPDSIDLEINTYQDTVYALICLGHVATWDDSNRGFRPGTKYGIGCRMKTSIANRISPSRPATPDLIIVTPPRGMVAEAKLSFHGSVADCESDLKQLMKYDDDLSGWPTPDGRIKAHDILLIVHYTRKGEATDILAAAKKAGTFVIKRKFAAVCFNRSPQGGSESMTLECFHGALTDRKLQRRMRPLAVPLAAVLPHHTAALYDYPPPMPLLLQLTWDRVFSTLVPPDEFLEPARKTFSITCSIDQVRELLADACGPPRLEKCQAEIPQRDWIKRMFLHLEQMGIARRIDSKPGSYTIDYCRKPSSLDFFKRMCLKITKPKTRLHGQKSGARPDLPGQMPMF